MTDETVTKTKRFKSVIPQALCKSPTQGNKRGYVS